jgi:hypothetical protein
MMTKWRTAARSPAAASYISRWLCGTGPRRHGRSRSDRGFSGAAFATAQTGGASPDGPLDNLAALAWAKALNIVGVTGRGGASELGYLYCVSVGNDRFNLMTMQGMRTAPTRCTLGPTRTLRARLP